MRQSYLILNFSFFYAIKFVPVTDIPVCAFLASLAGTNVVKLDFTMHACIRIYTLVLFFVFSPVSHAV
jgi:hypothetical protein